MGRESARFGDRRAERRPRRGRDGPESTKGDAPGARGARLGPSRRPTRPALAAAVLLAAAGAAGAARGQGALAPAGPAPVRQLNTDVAYSLFVLTNGGFSSIGHADYRDESIAAKIRVFSLPLRLPLETGLVGPIELRLAAGYGEASTTGAQRPAGATGPASGGPERERQFVSLRNLRFDIGRPVSLAPGLVLTPLLGVGAQHWSGKIDGIPAGGGPAPTGRVTFWTDALLTEAGAILEHRRRWGAVTLRPGASVSYIRLYDLDGRATQTEPVPARGRAKIAADSTVLRAAVRADAPLLGWRIGRRDLRWQVFVVGNYNTASVGLFPWSVETGAAVGAELGKLDRAMGGFDLGEFYVGASYIVGENFSGVRANLGFRF